MTKTIRRVLVPVSPRFERGDEEDHARSLAIRVYNRALTDAEVQAIYALP
jgi:hypothetical protein